MRNIDHPADTLTAAMSRIYRYRMTTTSGGNLSIRDAEGSIWITPARIDKGRLRREDIVCVRADGTVEGRHKPSSEFPFHRKIFQARPDLHAIVHAHPVALVAFSICGETPDVRTFAKASEICGRVGFAPYALPGSERLGDHIARAFAEGANCVMLENHGVVVGGRDFQEAFERFETLEFTAKSIIKARVLGNIRTLTPENLKAASRRRVELREGEAGEASPRECALRRELCDFVNRGYRQRLLISTEGSFSARVEGETFLITPHHVDRAGICPSDLVLIHGGQREPGKSPSHAVELHGAIYRKHPAVQAIVNATPVNATAYALSERELDSRTIPESYIFLRDVRKLDFDAVYSGGDELAAELDPKFPVMLVKNDGVMVLGTTILDAFDRLEVLEATAEALINSSALGEVSPMNDEVIDELTTAFLS